MIGHKHLVECHCVLQLYKNITPVVYHKFTVYSKIDNAGKIIPKYANCNNCGATHFVYEICKSDIKVGKEEVSSVRKVKDVKLSLPDKVVSILDDYGCEIDTFEQVEDIIDNEVFPYSIILKREIINDEHHIKLLNILGENKFKIESEIINTTIFGEKK